MYTGSFYNCVLNIRHYLNELFQVTCWKFLFTIVFNQLFMNILTLLTQRVTNPQIIPPINTYDAGQYATRVYQILFYLFFSFCVIAFLLMILIGGYQWVTSRGNQEALANARSRITNGVIGLLILLILFVIVRAVNAIFGINFAGWGSGGSVGPTAVPTSPPPPTATSVLPSPTPTVPSVSGYLNESSGQTCNDVCGANGLTCLSFGTDPNGMNSHKVTYDPVGGCSFVTSVIIACVEIVDTYSPSVLCNDPFGAGADPTEYHNAEWTYCNCQ